MGIFNRKSDKNNNPNTTAQIEAAKARVAATNRAINNGTFDSNKAFEEAMKEDYGLSSSDYGFGYQPSSRPSNRPSRQQVIASQSNRLNRVQESTFKNDIMNDLFKRQYKEIEAMRTEIAGQEFLKTMGLGLDRGGKYTSGFYEKMDEKDKKYLFLPYLMEKEAAGIISKKESAELKGILEYMKSNNVDLGVGYTKSVILLHALGVTDARDARNFESTFKLVDASKYDREAIAQIGDAFSGRTPLESSREASQRGGR